MEGYKIESNAVNRGCQENSDAIMLARASGTAMTQRLNISWVLVDTARAYPSATDDFGTVRPVCEVLSRPLFAGARRYRTSGGN